VFARRDLKVSEMKLDNIKLTAVDVDGTLLDGEQRLRDEVVNFLRELKNNGVIISLATGRSLQRVLQFTDRIDDEMPLILMNGAWVHDLESGNDWRALNLGKDETLRAIKLLREWGYEIIVQKPIPEAHIFFYDTLEKDNKERRERIQRNFDRCHQVDDLITVIENGAAEITILDTDERILKCREMLYQAGLDCRLTYSTSPFNPDYSWLEILHPDATKGKALEFLAGRLGIAREDVLAVGDNHNDLDMIEWAGVGAAMGHSGAEIRTKADIVLPKEDGGLCGLKEYFDNR